MAAIPLTQRGLNVVFVVFSLLVLGGSAYIMEQNLSTSVQTKASNVNQSLQGTLVKKGSKEYMKCKSISTTYAIVGQTPTACTSLSVQASKADPLVGKTVIASGTLQSGIFYATNLTAK